MGCLDILIKGIVELKDNNTHINAKSPFYMV